MEALSFHKQHAKLCTFPAKTKARAKRMTLLSMPLKPLPIGQITSWRRFKKHPLEIINSLMVVIHC